MRLDRATRPVVERHIRRGDADLPRYILDRGVRKLAPAARKPTLLRVEPQQQCESQPRRPALARHQRQLVINQRPSIDQLILTQLSRYARKLLLSPAS
jgi:hypothetical protein